MSNKIEIVMTCVGRSSFLRETLSLNLPKVDNVIVVTTPTDFETQRVCRAAGAECIQTDVFYKNLAPFDKGRAINEAVSSLKYNEWVLFTDCDIILLPAHLGLFTNNSLDKNLLYGCRRIILETRKDYEAFIRKIAFNPKTLDINKYINDDMREIGVGFFQLLNMNSKLIKGILEEELFLDDESFENVVMPIVKDVNYSRLYKKKGDLYPYFPTAGGSDSKFRHFFQERNAIAISNVPVIHLGSIGKGHAGATRNFE